MDKYLVKEQTIWAEWEQETAFPVKIQYENGEVCIIQKPEDIASGVGFKVLQTQVK